MKENAFLLSELVGSDFMVGRGDDGAAIISRRDQSPARLVRRSDLVFIDPPGQRAGLGYLLGWSQTAMGNMAEHFARGGFCSGRRRDGVCHR